MPAFMAGSALPLALYVVLFTEVPNFGSPNNVLTSPLFGQSTQTLANSLASGNNAGFNPLYQVGGPRSIQLALKLQF
jgi:hypothetical protein